MRFRLWILLIGLLAGSVTNAAELSVGMTVDEVEAIMGRPVNAAHAGNRAIHTYPNGEKLEFRDGRLYQAKGASTAVHINTYAEQKAAAPCPQPSPQPEATTPARAPAPADTPETSDAPAELTSPYLPDSTQPADLDRFINRDDGESSEAADDDSALSDRTMRVLIGLAINALINFIVLKIAFSLNGFPTYFTQLLNLSIMVAATSAAVEWFAGGFIYLDFGLGLIVLIGLIKHFTDVREWATAIRIGLIARLVAFGLSYLAGLALLTTLSGSS